MAVVKTLFRATVQTQTDLAEILRVMNRELSRDNEQMMFITAIVGRLTFETGAVIAVDAGHTPAFIVGPRGDVTATTLDKSIALGVDADAAFKVSTFRLDAGSTMLLYTDGATDARNTAGELFGVDRLQKRRRVQPRPHRHRSRPQHAEGREQVRRRRAAGGRSHAARHRVSWDGGHAPVTRVKPGNRNTGVTEDNGGNGGLGGRALSHAGSLRFSRRLRARP